MQVKPLPPEHYENIPETPVVLRSFDPESKQAALRYGEQLNRVLAPTGVEASLHGSTELELAGKGEWEFAIFPTDAQWYPILTLLINHFKGVYFFSDDFVVFASSSEDNEVEVIVMRGDVAVQNQAIMRYWREHPDARAMYEQEKWQHAYSKRAYYRWKDDLIASILESL